VDLVREETLRVQEAMDRIVPTDDAVGAVVVFENGQAAAVVVGGSPVLVKVRRREVAAGAEGPMADPSAEVAEGHQMVQLAIRHSVQHKFMRRIPIPATRHPLRLRRARLTTTILGIDKRSNGKFGCEKNTHSNLLES